MSCSPSSSEVIEEVVYPACFEPKKLLNLVE
jgi:hypothetical protein